MSRKILIFLFGIVEIVYVHVLSYLYLVLNGIYVVSLPIGLHCYWMPLVLKLDCSIFAELFARVLGKLKSFYFCWILLQSSNS